MYSLSPTYDMRASSGVAMTPQELLKLSREAMGFMNRHDFEEAARHWERILEVQPDWEHGEGAYNLATCYEEANQLENAARLYRKAILQEPENNYFLGGYGSFLYLHGFSQDAFEVYTKLFRQARARNNGEEEKALLTPLLELGTRIGLTESEVRQHLA
jgi:Tfp pilus assembly protein PilF